jgi:putative flippase GtrA
LEKNTTRVQLILFFMFGVGQYLLDAGLLYGLLLMQFDIYLANMLSRSLIGIVGFVANRYVTFKGTPTELGSSFVKFLVAWLFTSVLSTLGVMLALTMFMNNVYTPETGLLIKIIVELIVFVIAFFIQKYWIFNY